MFTVITVVTLALGIGANAAIFSVLQGVLLKPLPYPEADRLVAVDHAAPGVNLKNTGMAPFLYFTYREGSRTLDDIGMWQGDSLSVTGMAEPEQVPGVDVTDGVLPLLGAQPVLGRVFSRQDDSAGSPETVILSYAYWQRRFGGDAGVGAADCAGRARTGSGRRAVRAIPVPGSQADLFLPMRGPQQVFLGNWLPGCCAYETGRHIAQANADLARLIPISLRTFLRIGYNSKMFEEAARSACRR